MFRSSRGPTESLDARTIYSQKKRHMERTGTLGTSVNHDDRKFGATLARLMGVPLDDIKAMGLWSLEVMHEHYVKIHAPKTAAQMAGFGDAAHYFLPRAFISPFDISDDEISAFGHAIFPELDDPHWIAKIAEVCNNYCSSFFCPFSLSYFYFCAFFVA